MEALLTRDTLPLTLPLDEGAKMTVMVVDCPTASVTGNEIPPMPKPLPVTLPCVIVRLAVPVLLKETLRLLVVPSVTLPKLMLVGFVVSCPCVPVPLSEMVVGELDASLMSETLPVALPAAVGAKVAVKDVLCPVVRVRGSVRPLIENPLPVTLAWVIVRLAVPELLKLTVRLLVVPTLTLPKLTLVGLGVNCPPED